MHYEINPGINHLPDGNPPSTLPGRLVNWPVLKNTHLQPKKRFATHSWGNLKGAPLGAWDKTGCLIKAPAHHHPTEKSPGLFGIKRGIPASICKIAEFQVSTRK